jgi:hypothetical protein
MAPVGRLRHRGVLVVLLLLAVVNLPFLHGAWVDRQIDRDGVEVTATVTDTRESGDGGLVELRFDETTDPEQRSWTAALEADAFEQAVDSGSVDVRVVPGSPNRYRVDGQQGAAVLVALTVFADVVLLLALALLLRRRPDGPLRLVALEDVRRARPGGSLERLSPTTYEVTGEVSLIEADAVVLDVGGQQVRVDLGEFDNPVGYEQPAQVRCRLPESTP